MPCNVFSTNREVAINAPVLPALTQAWASIAVAGVAFAVTLVFVQVGLFIGLMDNATLTINQIDADLWVTSHNTANIDFAQMARKLAEGFDRVAHSAGDPRMAERQQSSVRIQR